MTNELFQKFLRDNPHTMAWINNQVPEWIMSMAEQYAHYYMIHYLDGKIELGQFYEPMQVALTPQEFLDKNDHFAFNPKEADVTRCMHEYAAYRIVQYNSTVVKDYEEKLKHAMVKLEAALKDNPDDRFRNLLVAYEGAVQGRSEFRQALRYERSRVKYARSQMEEIYKLLNKRLAPLISTDLDKALKIIRKYLKEQTV